MHGLFENTKMTACMYSLNFQQIIVTLIIVIQCMRISMAIDANLSLEIEGNGFHRMLIYGVNFKNLTNKHCQAAIYLELPSALYVNTDEMAELSRQKITTVCSVGETDIELFMEKAGSQNVTTCTLVNFSRSILRIPVHQRYQYARENGEYVNVILPEPRLFLGCRDRVKGHRVSKINLCQPCVNLAMKWREIPYNMVSNKNYTWLIPVGNSSLSACISYMTLLTTIIGAMFIAYAIRANVSKKQQKTD